MIKKYLLPKEYQLLEYDEVESTMTTAKNIVNHELRGLFITIG